jgi:hypothetical protein
MIFNDFNKAIQKKFEELSQYNLFKVDIDGDLLWETYLNSYPEGTNPIYKERTESDCQCCKQFIRACGNVVAIINNQLVSIWDIEIDGHYKVVADAMSGVVKKSPIRDVFLNGEIKLGTEESLKLGDDNKTIKFNHFYYELPSKFVSNNIGSKLSASRSNKEVLQRSLEEITVESAEIVIDLIDQNSLYRGEEHKSTIELFLNQKTEYDKIEDDTKDNFCWDISSNLGGVSKIRNTVIGTLLSDISAGMDLDKAVRLFESKVAPINYKRPTAIISKKMISDAKKKLEELGAINSLERRHATVEDLSVNDIIFVDRDTKDSLSGDVFDELSRNVIDKVKNLNRVEEITVNEFINNVVPKATKVEVMIENKHINNFMNVLAPVYKDVKNIFKWDNNFSWSYNGGVADSIKERVKNAGGNVNGVLRCSLSWFNYDDLDIHVREPNGNHIYYSRKENHTTSGRLDVDMNAGGRSSRSAVENITWTKETSMEEGIYHVYVNNYTLRETIDVGFDVEIEYNNTIYSFHYDKKVNNNQNITVAKFNFTHSGGIEFIESLPSTTASKEVWGISTQKFHDVQIIMNSPNHWNGKETGNKHWFFIINNAYNDKSVRGFFNEYLNEEFTPHRKVFEVLGNTLKVDPDGQQLAGIGFSSTIRNELLVKVSGSFNRLLRIKF